MTDSPRTAPEANATFAQAFNARGDETAIVEVDEPSQQVVLFQLSGQPFALPGQAVSEILKGDTPVYFVPGLPDSTEGVIHLRGQIESLITLQPLLGLAPSQTDGMMLVVKGAGIRSAVRIDQLQDVCELPISALKTPPDTLPSALRPYVSALWQSDDTQRATALLDPDALLQAYLQGLG
ncbi:MULTISPECIES: chemotaxis protein CheW [Halomonadaceae]|jgi:purine-binding chemotaxis protein CheW|uniref:Chemotaxis protein CheW n=1 Tax=Vreelandella piezotolerans TaxID=2609667 RepID=A0ABQ6X9Y6_9GAMM|nr:MULTISPECIES: chemotaxis protein CheW [Halomonas]KAE8438823.1 chemotaxis protein CheW [Halomonas piezotolerans]MCG7577928.1 chemotaxis protein CheW [Halomonas sp. MMH1-48]MCG7590317.1 chemotaxis protein CheW [Halomonas sp. McD50-5]MCG7604994.1 chemotaxis protein CheW [Halomonas sp. MM17-34]MCG7614171.1 chemotaxis protein CheW [Halomonas sp. MM17-29]